MDIEDILEKITWEQYNSLNDTSKIELKEITVQRIAYDMLSNYIFGGCVFYPALAYYSLMEYELDRAFMLFMGVDIEYAFKWHRCEQRHHIDLHWDASYFDALCAILGYQSLGYLDGPRSAYETLLNMESSPSVDMALRICREFNLEDKIASPTNQEWINYIEPINIIHNNKEELDNYLIGRIINDLKTWIYPNQSQAEAILDYATRS